MKKILLCCLLLISGCAQETIEGEQIIGYAEYCINEDCSEKKQIRLEKRHQETIQNYFDESVLNDNYHYNEECARLIMIDLSSNTNQRSVLLGSSLYLSLMSAVKLLPPISASFLISSALI